MEPRPDAEVEGKQTIAGSDLADPQSLKLDATDDAGATELRLREVARRLRLTGVGAGMGGGGGREEG